MAVGWSKFYIKNKRLKRVRSFLIHGETTVTGQNMNLRGHNEGPFPCSDVAFDSYFSSKESHFPFSHMFL